MIGCKCLYIFLIIIVVDAVVEQNEPVAFARLYLSEKSYCGVQGNLRGGRSFIDEPFSILD